MKPQVLSTALAGEHLTDVASSVGLDFRQGSFRYGISNEAQAMMGGGVCWLDYNGDGWQDLFVVNSYSSDDAARWAANGGLPRSALYENVHGTFRDVSRAAHADLPVQGDGCVAADLNGDGRPDLVVTTSTGIHLLWNNGNGTFAEGGRAAGMTASGWYTGVTVADVNGDGRPDVFVAGYTAPNEPVPNSLAGFPTSLAGVRDLLYLNEGNDANGHARFREVGVQAGLEAAAPRHGLGAQFLDVNGDGRPDLYVADDEDPNQLYVNVPWPGGARADPAGLGFRFEERGSVAGVADPYAGMGIASRPGANGSVDLFVTNSRGERSGAFRGSARSGATFRERPPRLRPGARHRVRRLGSDLGRPRQLRHAGPRARRGRDPGDESRRRRRAGARARARRHAQHRVRVRRRELRPRRRPQAERARRRRRGRRERRAHGRRDQHDRRQARAPPPTGPSGHWLDVQLSRFAPGAVVTVTLPDGRRLARTVQAGSSYLSSEDQRVHFGLGAATSVRVAHRALPVGRRERPQQRRREPGRADRVPAARQRRRHDGCDAGARGLHAGAAAGPVGGADLERRGGRRAPAGRRVGARPGPRPLRPLGGDLAGLARDRADRQSRETAISYAAYRLLVWRASYGANLDRAFALLTGQLRGLCLSPDFTRTSGGSPAALGNRIGAAAIAAGRHDGSNEALHYADPGYLPTNGPLVLQAAGSTVHDATFWQPLALSQKAAQGGSPAPADVQTFQDSQWGRVRTFAARVAAGAPRPRRPVERRLQAGRRRGDPRRVAAGRPVRSGRVAARLEPRSPRHCPPGRVPPRASRTTSGSISP